MSGLDEMTTWRRKLSDALDEEGETWADVESCTLTDAELDTEFDDGFGLSEGRPFTLWTKGHVYFPVVYDGSESVGSVPRHPNGEATGHQGGQ